MNNQLLDLLAEIGRGETAFKAEGETREDLRQFRDKVQDLKRLQKLGHIEILELHESVGLGHRLYDAALTSMTDHGRRFLTDKCAPKQGEKSGTMVGARF
jgi:hypothetical protein